MRVEEMMQLAIQQQTTNSRSNLIMDEAQERLALKYHETFTADKIWDILNAVKEGKDLIYNFDMHTHDNGEVDLDGLESAIERAEK